MAIDVMLLYVIVVQPGGVQQMACEGAYQPEQLEVYNQACRIESFFLLMKLNEIGMEQRYESQLTMVLPTAATQKAPDAHNKG